jgi:hypothetical protein
MNLSLSIGYDILSWTLPSWYCSLSDFFKCSTVRECNTFRIIARYFHAHHFHLQALVVIQPWDLSSEMPASAQRNRKELLLQKYKNKWWSNSNRGSPISLKTSQVPHLQQKFIPRIGNSWKSRPKLTLKGSKESISPHSEGNNSPVKTYS